MKKFLSGTAMVVAVSLFAIGCNNNPNSTSTDGKTDSSGAATSTDAKMNTDTSTMQSAPINNGGTSTSDNEFVTAVAGGGMMEIESAKIAQTNAASADVKSFATMMINDHTKAADELKSIAAAENINFPANIPAEHQAHLDMLKAKTGADFDKTYMDMMVEDHAKTVEAFKTAAKENKNEKVKAFAAKTLPTIEAHLVKAKAVKGKMK